MPCDPGPAGGAEAAPGKGPAAATALAVAFCATLAGCALTAPGPAAAPALPAAWQAPLPATGAHGADAAALAQWWARFDDPLLVRLVDAAQRGNGDLAQAAARIEQARATLRAAGSRNWPEFDGGARAERVRTEVGPLPGTVVATSSRAGVDALWEIDLFGVTRNTVRAAQARSEGAQLAWHDLRVSLAAEVAATYVSLRACEALVDVYAQDAQSQQRTAELTLTKARAGLESAANGALARASAADASTRLIGQQAECEVIVNTLSVLTTLPQSELRPQLAARSRQLPQPAQFQVSAVPAQWLAQRPDLAALEREVLAAAAEVGAARADRYPSISLGGSIALANARAGGVSASGINWTVGPTLSVPLFDAGRRAAQVDAAQARYAEARARYEQRVRAAAAEVEQALLRLDAATRREADARTAAEGFGQYFAAQQALFAVGVGSLLDLEQARRNALLAAAGLVNLQRERVAAWITLYKSLGGGWSATPPALAAAPSTPHPTP